MYPKLSPRRKSAVSSEQNQLTEANLRLHTSTSPKTVRSCEAEERIWPKSAEIYEQLYDDFSDADDEDMNVKSTHVALRRAASLQALKAYGGCFASGFLAMQEPLPCMPRKWSNTNTDAESLDLQKLASEMSLEEMNSMRTISSHTQDRIGSPRPDSDTLSQVDMSDVKNERRWWRRSMGKRRRNSAK